jgi:deazaflavin-dependent oxidoreductase (nitroreductase family)
MASWNDRNERIINEFRENEGRVGGTFEGRTLLILRTTGAKSGTERLNPLVTREVGEKLVIAASKGGAPTHPDWYYNLVANPIVGVEYGTDKFEAEAKVVSEPQRSELYAKFVEYMPAFGEYEKQTERVIPVITLTPLK